MARKADLTIGGNGSLMAHANYNDAIASKDGLEITAGNITVNALSDGIRGRDYLRVKGGDITVKAGGDGLKSTNDEDPQRGLRLHRGRHTRDHLRKGRSPGGDSCRDRRRKP